MRLRHLLRRVGAYEIAFEATVKKLRARFYPMKSKVIQCKSSEQKLRITESHGYRITV